MKFVTCSFRNFFIILLTHIIITKGYYKLRTVTQGKSLTAQIERRQPSITSFLLSHISKSQQKSIIKKNSISIVYLLLFCFVLLFKLRNFQKRFPVLADYNEKRRKHVHVIRSTVSSLLSGCGKIHGRRISLRQICITAMFYTLRKRIFPSQLDSGLSNILHLRFFIANCKSKWEEMSIVNLLDHILVCLKYWQYRVDGNSTFEGTRIY